MIAIFSKVDIKVMARWSKSGCDARKNTHRQFFTTGSGVDEEDKLVILFHMFVKTAHGLGFTVVICPQKT